METLEEWILARSEAPAGKHQCDGVRPGDVACLFKGEARVLYVSSAEPLVVWCGACIEDAARMASAAVEAAERIEQADALGRDLLVREINSQRDRLIDGGFDFAGHRYQSRASDRENIMTMGQLAKLAVSAGVQAGDLRWADPGQDFGWITADNSIVPLDAHEMSSLFAHGVAYKSTLTFFARELKNAVLAAETLEVARAIAAAAVWPV